MQECNADYEMRDRVIESACTCRAQVSQWIRDAKNVTKSGIS